MKLSRFLIAGAAAVSFSAVAAAPHDEHTIRQAQERLAQEGHGVTADGMMGPMTQQALRSFQKQQGLEPTGQLDAQTLSALGIGEPASARDAPAAAGATAPPPATVPGTAAPSGAPGATAGDPAEQRKN